jgi:polysaccharide biosynthesis/export protein
MNIRRKTYALRRQALCEDARSRAICIAIALICFPLFAAGASAQTPASRPTTLPTSAGAQAIRPGDFVWLTVSVAGEPMVNDTLMVNEFGTLAVPHLGDVSVVNETRATLRQKAQTQLGENLRNPVVELVVLKRVRVTGSVIRPNLYYLDPTLTVADALAMAGGYAPDAKQDATAIRRGGQVVLTDLRIDTAISESPLQSGDELFVPQKSWIARNGSAVLGSAVGVAGLVVALLAR